MKRFIFASFLVLSLAGCQCSAPDVQDQKLVSICFSGLNIEVSQSRAAFKDACTALNYYRYTGGVQTGSKRVTSTDTDFGFLPMRGFGKIQAKLFGFCDYHYLL